MEPLDKGQVPIPRREFHGLDAHGRRTRVRMEPLDHPHLVILGRHAHFIRAPKHVAMMCIQPLEHVHVPGLGRLLHGKCNASVRVVDAAEPRQHAQIAPFRGKGRSQCKRILATQARIGRGLRAFARIETLQEVEFCGVYTSRTGSRDGKAGGIIQVRGNAGVDVRERVEGRTSGAECDRDTCERTKAARHARRGRRRQASAMLALVSQAAFAAAVTLAAGPVAASQTSAGVTYDPSFHATITRQVLENDMKLIAQHFQAVRSTTVKWGKFSVVEIAAAANLRVAVGIDMTDPARVADEIKSFCDDYKAHPSTVEAVYVGHENLKDRNSANYSVATDIVYQIGQVKKCVGSHVPVGTSQRVEEWRSAPNLADIVTASDIIGFTVDPYQMRRRQTPITVLKAQYAVMLTAYGAEKLHLTQTGYPHCGEPHLGNVASIQAMTDYFSAFITEFLPGKNRMYWHTMFDLAKAPGTQYDKCYGLFSTTGGQNILKFP
ncbi:hypothetical protein PsorP6_015439 [Peronosclerospora sorghi]|uniref:Uncharacterized protein n=1 Tax=Peronosclerospora sorghi TaxID=230839 RepID=A0ACC0WM51_9STRA|nr:hypothetical protein PsorP6_015439 [Peronosclerospora sorghi]